ncbi:MAG TPA: permease, partial [Pseudomonas sp.]|nr:permease [Pseudomonas sp.]
MATINQSLPGHQKTVILCGGGLLLGLLVLSMSIGAGVYGASDVLGYLLGDPLAVADEKLAMVVDTLRLPRDISALVEIGR